MQTCPGARWATHTRPLRRGVRQGLTGQNGSPGLAAETLVVHVDPAMQGLLPTMVPSVRPTPEGTLGGGSRSAAFSRGRCAQGHGQPPASGAHSHTLVPGKQHACCYRLATHNCRSPRPAQVQDQGGQATPAAGHPTDGTHHRSWPGHPHCRPQGHRLSQQEALLSPTSRCPPALWTRGPGVWRSRGWGGACGLELKPPERVARPGPESETQEPTVQSRKRRGRSTP